jgi:phage shock protein PspC (stress-responsive transcriptional regulator)/FtsH-binding integral membrane protein
MSEEQAATGPASANSGAGTAASNPGDGGPAGSPAGPPGRTPVRRSTHDRYIAGVCGGVGRATDVDPVIYRVVLAVLTLFGGIGVLLYALGWLLLPAEDEEQSEAQKLLSGRGRSSSVLPLIGVAVSTILVIAFISAGSDIAILVIIAFVVLAVVLSKQRQESQASTAQPGPVVSTPSAPPGTAPAASITTPRSTAPSFGSPYPSGPYPSSPYPSSPYPSGSYPGSAYATSAPGFGTPWPGRDPYLPMPAQESQPKPFRREHHGSWLGFLTMAVAAVVGGILVATGVASTEDNGLAVVAACVLVVIGLGLLVGTWAGRSRGLIGWGILATLALVTVATFDVPLRGGTGQRLWAPTTVPAAEAAPYRLTAGEGTLDLRELEPAAGTTADVEASVTVGRLVVDVPADATVEVNGHVGLGHLALLTDPDTRVDRGGFNLTADSTDAADSPASGGRIVLDVEVGVGELEVRRAPASR